MKRKNMKNWLFPVVMLLAAGLLFAAACGEKPTEESLTAEETPSEQGTSRVETVVDESGETHEIVIINPESIAFESVDGDWGEETDKESSGTESEEQETTDSEGTEAETTDAETTETAPASSSEEETSSGIQTIKDFLELSSQEQAAYAASFGDYDAFIDWYWAAIDEWKATHESTKITIDSGDVIDLDSLMK